MTESFAELFEESIASQRIKPGTILTGTGATQGGAVLVVAGRLVGIDNRVVGHDRAAGATSAPGAGATSGTDGASEADEQQQQGTRGGCARGR